MGKIIAASSWSGGKDSCFACYKALQSGYEIKYLVNFISREHRRCCFHGVEAGLLKLQAERIGIPLMQKEVAADMKQYEKEFKEAMRGLISEGIGKVIFGDIYLLDNVNWVERVCKDAGVTPVEPLWNMPPSEIIEEFIGSGFKAVVVSCKDDCMGKEFIGRPVDRKFVAELKRRNICPCGENGEFHTLVVDGPIFRKKIEILESEPILKEGFWKHWFLDIKRYE